MRKLYLFMMISADGYFEGNGHDLNWHNTDIEFDQFAIRQLEETGAIIFGRKTYELMSGFWPSEEAKKMDPIVAKYMNDIPKYVCSTTLKTVSWANTQLIKKEIVKEIAGLKQRSGKDIALFGSSKLCVFLAKHGLVDEFRIMVNPVFLGHGTPLFDGLEQRLRMKLVKTQLFASGNILCYYQFLPLSQYEKDNRDGVRDD